GISASAEDATREAARASWKSDEFLDRMSFAMRGPHAGLRVSLGNPIASDRRFVWSLQRGRSVVLSHVWDKEIAEIWVRSCVPE
ncbi:MAG: hypothetical protein ABSD48_21095, partial [Armatimonadota bacterium]